MFKGVVKTKTEKFKKNVKTQFNIYDIDLDVKL